MQSAKNRRTNNLSGSYTQGSADNPSQSTENKKYITRSEKNRITNCSLLRKFEISILTVNNLPYDLKYMIAKYTFKSAYLFGFKSLMVRSRPNSLKLTLMVYRRITKTLVPLLTFFYDDSWHISIADDHKPIHLDYLSEYEFRNQLLLILLSKFLLVTSDCIYVKYNYQFDIYTSLKPFKILKYDPKFDESDIFKLFSLYLDCLDSFDLCFASKDNYFMYQYEEHTGFEVMDYQWIISHESIYKVFYKRSNQSYYICQYGTYEDVEAFEFVHVNGETGKPGKNHYSAFEAFNKIRG